MWLQFLSSVLSLWLAITSCGKVNSNTRMMTWNSVSSECGEIAVQRKSYGSMMCLTFIAMPQWLKESRSKQIIITWNWKQKLIVWCRISYKIRSANWIVDIKLLKEEKISPLFFLYTRLFTIFANYQMIFMEGPTNRITEVLIEKGIKQTWLAEKLGKSFTIVNSYVCNRRQPSLELLFQIAEILQINPKELINTPDE